MSETTLSPAVVYKPWPSNPSVTVGDDGSITAKVNRSHKYDRIRHGRRWHYVHRIVCETFHGPAPAPGMFALHDNDVDTDNRAANLRWGTRKDNGADAVRNGRFHGHGSPLSEEQVNAIRALLDAGVSGAAAGRQFGISRQAVHQIKVGKAWAGSSGMSRIH